jgi:cytochrome c553
MWDTREPSLASQFIDATLTHAQARTAPSLTVANEGVAFQSGSFTSQSFDSLAGDLTGADGSGATGGPQNLYNYSNTVPFTGFPFALFEGGCLTNAKPCPGSILPQVSGLPDVNFFETNVFNAAFAAGSAQRASIYRGAVIFNSRPFVINGVTGLNDLFGATNLTASCSFCHNNGNVGNDLFNDPKHIGVGDNSYVSAAQSSANGSSTLPLTPDRPVFTFLCPVGSITYFSNPITITRRSSLYGGVSGTFDEYQTSDPGVGWITGKCGDLGKFKVSPLRGIGARAPFFHGGQAATMRDVVLFYNNRFSIGLSEQDIEDLTNYLNAE